MRSRSDIYTRLVSFENRCIIKLKQDHQALLLKAKYCQQVAAASYAQKKAHVTLTVDLKSVNRVLEVVYVSAKFHQTNCAAVY